MADKDLALQEEKNKKIAEEIKKQNLVDEKTLESTLDYCNQQNLNLGQTLVRQHKLQPLELVKILKTISQIDSKEAIRMSTKTPDAKATQSERPEMIDTKTDPSQGQGPITPPGSKEVGTSTAQGKGDNSKGITGSQFGEYKILGEIARGGMGIVYRALDSVNRVVALKVLLSGDAADSIQIQRFFREAKATASLNHPNIVPVYSTGKVNNYHYFTMKYIPGGTFQKMIEKDTSLSKKLDIMIKTCQAVHHAHENGILHRDLKPSNILLDEQGEPYITDFGLAKFIDSKSALTQTGSTLGTPFYMSPEQARGDKKKIDRRSDVYSLGVMLYQILTMKLPFTGNTLTELYKSVLEEEPEWPKNCDASLCAICKKSMEKEQEYRYQTALEMADDLILYQQGKSVKAKKVNVKIAMSRLKRQYSKRVLLTLGILLPILVALCVVPYAIYIYREKQSANLIRLQTLIKKSCADAQDLVQKGEYKKALQTLVAAEKEAKDSFEIYSQLGEIYQKTDNIVEARNAFDKAYLLAPGNGNVIYKKALFHREQGELEEANKLIDMYVNKNPDLPEGYRERANILRKLGKDKEASQNASYANNLETHKLQGVMSDITRLVDEKRTEDAFEALHKVLKNYPSYEKAYLTRGQLYKQQGEQHKALEDISEAIELNPCIEYLHLKAQWLRDVGYLKEAKELLLKIVKRNDDNDRPTTLYDLANLELELGEYESAYQHYNEIVAGGTDNGSLITEANLGMAKSSYYMKRYDVSERHLASLRVPKLSENLKCQFYYYKACLFYQNGKHKDAMKYFNKALSSGKYRENEIHLFLGEIYFKDKEFSNALPYLEKASQAFPENSNVHFLSGMAYMEEKKAESAIQAFSRCIELEPWQAIFYIQRARSYASLKQFEYSEKDYLKCQVLEPNNLVPLLEFFSDIFQQQFLMKIKDLKILFSEFGSESQLTNAYVNLYHEEIRKLGIEHIQQALNFKKMNKSTKVQWDERKARVFLKGLVEHESSSVHNMSCTGLLSMPSNVQLIDIIESELKKQEIPKKAKERLQGVLTQIKNKYFEEQKIFFRQLLARFYTAKDEDALKTIYHQGLHGIECLQSLLMDEKENGIVRFLAAQALLDIKVPSARLAMDQYSQTGTLNSKLLCNAVLSQHKQQVEPKAFQDVNKAEDPFIRFVAVKYMPWKDKTFVKENLLNDPEERVQLQAAARLYESGDEEAGKNIARFLDHPSPVIRSFSISTLWNLESLKKNISENDFRQVYKRCTENYWKSLIKALDDPDRNVRRIAVIRVAQSGYEDYKQRVFAHLKDKDDLVRFQAILSLGLQLEIEMVMPILLDHKEPLLFRFAAFAGGVKSAKKVPGSILTFLGKLLKDKDERIRLLMFWMAGRLGKEMGLSYVTSNLFSKDPYTKIGCLCSLIDNGTAKEIPKILKLFKDPNPDVRFAAATGVACLTGQYKKKELEKIYELIGTEDSEIRKGAAYGYAMILYDRVKTNKSEGAEKADINKVYYEFIGSMIETIKSLEVKKAEDKVAFFSLEEFIHIFSKAIELDPDTPRYRFERGILYFMKCDYEKSLADIKEASKMTKNIPFHKFWIAQVYYASHQKKEALENLDDYLKEFPWDYEGHILKYKILESLGQKQEAEIVKERSFLLK